MLDHQAIANALRFLSIDAVQKANSGHPGMPMGMADIATVLWREFLNHNPKNPQWANRDRFVLSNGHGSMLLYALLHLTGYDLPMEELKNFRQLHSKTPGHPEFGLTPGVETTTGPLGQGFANAVGMALAEKILGAQFNRPGFPVINHRTYVFVGDGCLMEGISHEVASFAGTHGLGKLIVFWDDNGISIDGGVEGWFSEDVGQRFRAYGWQVMEQVDGHNPEKIREAIMLARNNIPQPSLICCKTVIGYGSPTLCNSHGCHGSPLGSQEIALVRENLTWPHDPFVIPEDIYKSWDAKDNGKRQEQGWQQLFDSYRENYPSLAKELLRRWNGDLPGDWIKMAKNYIAEVAVKMENLATRQSSQQTLNGYGPMLPELLGGSADLTSSNLTNWSGSRGITKEDATGNYLHYGVREFGMGAMMNGMALHGGFIPYGGTFLAFANYSQSAVRMAALMKCRVIYVFTHDSIGLGEDGPTHQPVEHLAMLRATPNLSVWRPADATETAVAWHCALERVDGPTALILSRQKLPAQRHVAETLTNISRGGYVLIDCADRPDIILIASGSEVALACSVATVLQERKVGVRVVSMPSQDQFDRQDEYYKNMVLPREIKHRVAMEAAASISWYKYVGLEGMVIGLDRYGESAPEKILFELFGFSEDNIIRLIFRHFNL